MAHSFDKTYLAALGFGDADRKKPEHDIACQYLGQPDVTNAIALSMFGQPDLVRGEPKYEHALTKGEGQYKVTIGFLDLLIRCRIPLGESRGNGYLAFEVKVSKAPVSEIIRQIKFYSEFSSSLYNLYWIAALRFDISQEELRMFQSENIRVIRLGDKFDEFMAQCEEDEPAVIEEF